MRTRLKTSALLLTLALVVSGCTAAKAMRQGDEATKAGDLDQAVSHYRRAVQEDPDNADYEIALQRAMQAASRAHLDRAREFEAQDHLEAAVSEYRLATEYDPSNRLAAGKVSALDRVIRERIEAARPRPFQDMQARARATSPVPILSPTSDVPITFNAVNTPIRDILNTIANVVGINVIYDRDLEAQGAQGIMRLTTIPLEGVTIEQALNQILSVNQLAYKVVSPRQILVFQDNAQKHQIYDDQVIQTFPIAHAKPDELATLLSQLVRPTGIGVQPMAIPNLTNNTIVAKASVSMMQIIERIIQVNDKPPAEVVIDVEILEVNRNRAKQYGLNLSQYAFGLAFSPETVPSGAPTPPTTPGQGGGTGGTSTPPSALVSPPVFNLNTISRGISTSDFYLAVPTAVVRFLESDTQTKLIAKPQLRGTEGLKMSLRLGDRIPLPSTTFVPTATGGAGQNPLTTFTYTDVGVNLDLTPRVTPEGDIMLDLIVENSSLGGNLVVNDVSSPTIGTRIVTSRLRLRDGESNLLAGLLREEERKSLTGFPGAIHVPFLKQVFSANDNEIKQTDIVMLLTPHIVRGKEITEADLRPIYLGSGTNWSLGGPPPLISVPDVAPTPGAPAPGAPPPGAAPGAGGVQIGPPPGSSPVPGTIATPVPVLPAPTPPTSTAPPPATTPVPPATTPPPTNPPPQTGVVDPVVTSAGLGSAVVVLTPPSSAFRVGGGPYNIPITVSNVSRLSTISITVGFDPTRLRVRSVSEGSFMRSGGANATFSYQQASDRVDITITRPNDATGATGSGLLGAILFDAVGPGLAPLSMSGVATGPGGTPMGLQLRPISVTVQP